MKRKIVFFDIDGTIYSYRNGMPQDTLESICSLKKNGHIPVICTGRTKCMIYPGHMAPGFEHIVAGAGTYIEIGGKEIYLSELNAGQIEEVTEICRQNGLVEIGEGKNHFYLGKESANLTGELKKIRDVYLKEMGNIIKEFGSEGMHLSKMSAFICPDCNLEQAIEHGSKNYNMVNHRNCLLEFIPKGEGKAQGIERMIQYLGMSREDTISFGDSFNDMDMLEYTAFSVAMGNGDEEVKQISDYVTTAYDQGGITKALKMLHLI
jgi:Cof subfamily protein (haloacid dehalogenase superfamily)